MKQTNLDSKDGIAYIKMKIAQWVCWIFLAERYITERQHCSCISLSGQLRSLILQTCQCSRSTCVDREDGHDDVDMDILASVLLHVTSVSRNISQK